jgi:hypothetical protein
MSAPSDNENIYVSRITTMSLLSSHRLHWGSHHEITDHLRVIIDRMITAPEPSADVATPQTVAPFKSDVTAPAAPSSAQMIDGHLEVLGP